jgi:aldehyde:ferredoxin oxidoreductase
LDRLANLDHLAPKGQVAASRGVQVTMAAIDSLGLCLMTAPAIGERLDLLAQSVSSRLGVKWTEEDVVALDRETITLEREFNRRAGFTALDDRIPEWMHDEPLPLHGTVFDVPNQEIDQICDFE